MRVVPAPGMALRDYRTRRHVDPELGVEVDPHDFTFAWLLDHGDCVELSDEDYAAALEKREADQKAAAADAADSADAGAAATEAPQPQPPSSKAKASPPAAPDTAVPERPPGEAAERPPQPSGGATTKDGADA